MRRDKSLHEITKSGGIAVSLEKKEGGGVFKERGDKRVDGKCDGWRSRGLDSDTGEALSG